MSRDNFFINCILIHCRIFPLTMGINFAPFLRTLGFTSFFLYRLMTSLHSNGGFHCSLEGKIFSLVLLAHWLLFISVDNFVCFCLHYYDGLFYEFSKALKV